MPTERTSRRTAKASKARWNAKRERPDRDTRRPKISTTIAPESHAFLARLVEEGKADSLAQAIDLVLEEARRIDNQERLERMTEEAYASMSPEAIAETRELEQALTQSVGELNLDE